MTETITTIIRVKVTDDEKAQLGIAYKHLERAVAIMKHVRDKSGERGRAMILKDENDMDGVYTINASDTMQDEVVDRVKDAMVFVLGIQQGYYYYSYNGEYEDGGTDPDFEVWLGQQEQEARDRAWEG
jgi:hypothetical protein